MEIKDVHDFKGVIFAHRSRHMYINIFRYNKVYMKKTVGPGNEVVKKAIC